jgi:hypothetical protein
VQQATGLLAVNASQNVAVRGVRHQQAGSLLY